MVTCADITGIEQLPEPRSHMQFALEDFETVGGTSAGKALHLSGLGRKVACHTLLGDDAESGRLRSVLAATGIEVIASVVPASYICMNADGIGDPLAFMRARVEAGATAVVCTLGADGAVAFDADGLHRVNAVTVDVRDTNGAGDAFLAGYLDATLHGASTDTALTSVAAQAAVALGAKHLHPSFDVT